MTHHARDIYGTREIVADILRTAAEQAPLVLEQLSSQSHNALLEAARAKRDEAFGNIVTYSPKAFVPLTKLCRNRCHYCTFVEAPSDAAPDYMSPEEVLEVVRKAEARGCTELLLTLGDKPERRYESAQKSLARLGYSNTIEYVHAISKLILENSTMLPHVNPGVMTWDEIASLREVSVSQGLMLETTSSELLQAGRAHYRSPDKVPAVRMRTLVDAGRLNVPMTSGILFGLGETVLDRITSLLALELLHQRYGHIQEVIVQNFRAKTDTLMHNAAEPDMTELLWTAAAARIILSEDISLQVPPNLSSSNFPELLSAGINDWGGISPLTPDFVNPEAPWPEIARLQDATEDAGFHLEPRLPIYPRYVQQLDKWLDASMRTSVTRRVDAEGFPRDTDWHVGMVDNAPAAQPGPVRAASTAIETVLSDLKAGVLLNEAQVTRLFAARGNDVEVICQAADELRQKTCGGTVTYAVNRNINYTNICKYSCSFCAFSKANARTTERESPYNLGEAEIKRRAAEAWARGATEVCMQGGIHPGYTGEVYLQICKWIKEAVPDMHIHAFSPLEVTHGAETLDLTVREFLEQLKDAGLGSLPGTAAEILDDDVRDILCADKVNTEQWLDVAEAAADVGLRMTATIMFGHVEQPVHWARHLLHLRGIQMRTGVFTELVPLPFVHMDAPVYKKGEARMGPTFREVRLMHAIARLVLHPHITNIQASWVKVGPKGIGQLLNGGVNDLGGTLMNESISRAAGTQHGQEMGVERLEALIEGAARMPKRRSTLYASVSEERQLAARHAVDLQPVKYERIKVAKRRLAHREEVMQ